MGGFTRPKHFPTLICNFLLSHDKVVLLFFSSNTCFHTRSQSQFIHMVNNRTHRSALFTCKCRPDRSRHLKTKCNIGSLSLIHQERVAI